MKSILKEFADTMRPIKGRSFWYFFGIIGMTIGNTSIGVVSSVLLKQFVDGENITSLAAVDKIVKILAIYLMTLTIMIPSCQYLYNRVAKLAYSDTKKKIFYKILKLPVPYFEKVHTGKILSVLINDSDKMMGVVTGSFRRTFAPFIQIITYIIPILLFEWRIALVMIGVDLITLYGDLKFSGKIKEISRQVQQKLSVMNEKLMNIIGGVLIVRMFSVGNQMVEEYMQANKEMSKMNLAKARTNGLHNSYTFMVSMLNTLLFLLCSNILVVMGITTYGSILGIMSMQIILNESFKSFCQYLPQIFDGFAGTARVYEFLNLPEEVPLEMEDLKQPSYIQFKDVNFRYTESHSYVLQKFNLSMKQNETVAVVGESGSGKSTIAKLLMGFYSIDKGAISVEGKRIGDMSFHKLRSLISYVPQDAYIFNGTILDNIQYGRCSASSEEIYNAAKAANAFDFIMQMSDGFQTMVGERGTKLSGGQRQRIAIARAILKDAPILILDEATASLDSESEASIKSAIDQVRKNKTTIIIAHRLSTIEGADRVVKVG